MGYQRDVLCEWLLLSLVVKIRYLNFVSSYGSSSSHRKLENCCYCASQEILPVDWVNVGGLGMSVAGVLLTLETSMFRIVEFDDKSLDGLPSLFYGNQHTSTAVGQPIQGVDVVDQDDVAPNFDPQLILKWCVADTTC